MSEFTLLEKVLTICEKRGATAAVALSRGNEWSTQISKGKVELHEAASSRHLGIQCYLADGRSASVSTNDLQESTLTRLGNEAVDLAEAGSPDQWQGLPDANDCGSADIDGLDDGGLQFNEESAVQLILDAERIARDSDKRIIASHRSGVSMNRGSRWLACSNGVRQERHGSSYSAQLVLVAEDHDEKQMGYSWTANRDFTKLRSAELLAQEAVEKALAGYGWKQAPTGVSSVVLSNEVASQLLGLVNSLASGDAVYKKGTCWADKLGQIVANPCISIVDNPLIPGALGSRRSDSNGVKSRLCEVITQGVLNMFFTSTYSSRRLQQPLTAHAGGSSNLQLQAGTVSEAELLKQMGRGLYITKLQGHGVDISSGHWSKGAEGYWIENGERVHPVQNSTVAGNLLTMFQNIQAVANNPRQEASTSSPSLLLSGMQIGGSN